MNTDIIARLPLMYIGIPWVACGTTMAGADCWGLVRMAAHHLYGLEFPEYFYSAHELLSEAAQLIEHETNTPRWKPQPNPPFEPGAVHIFRIAGLKTHCGLALEGGDFLHSLPGHASAIENVADIQWRQRRTGTFVWMP